MKRGAIGFAGGLLFLAIFQWRYAGLDPDLFRWRDDGLITLSHARNWVDFGFIGINPSGERLEATSAPLQMLLYAALYAIGGMGYETFALTQTLVCTFAVGAIVATLLGPRPVFALVATAAIAAVLTQMGSFVVWHASGMENALLHALLAGTVLLLYRFGTQGRVDLRWAVVPFAASIVRVEAIFHVAPLLIVFCIAWAAMHGGRDARRFSIAVAALWAVFNLWRYLYFGSLMPNTAVAQGISVGDRLVELVTLSPLYLDQSFSMARVVFSRHGGYLLLLALPFLLLRPRRGNSLLLLALAATLILTSLAAPFVFGAARLDPSRTTTFMAIFVPIAVAAAVMDWQPHRFDRYSIPIVALLVLLIHEYAGLGPYSACCSIRDFDATRRAFQQLAEREAIPRATVANPDLGVMSWHKQFNVVDLGLLGSSLVPRIAGDDAEMRRYFFDYAAPDIVESHGFWSCRYATLFAQGKFMEAYVPAGKAGTPTTTSCKGVDTPVGVWLRKDVLRTAATDERRLMDDLNAKLDVARVSREIAACAAKAGDAARCAYVGRAVYRLLPELRAQGSIGALRQAFEASPSREWDLTLIDGAQDARAWRRAKAYLEKPPPR